MKMRKFLIIALSLILALALASCGTPDNPNTPDNPAEEKFTITWKNFDGSILCEEEFNKGDFPTFTGATPQRAPTASTYYAFAGWTPEVSKVSGNATYTATYEETVVGTHTEGFEPEFSADGKTVKYGLYPQKHVSDSALIATLETLSPSVNGWVLYEGKYYAKETAKVFTGADYKFKSGTAIVSGTAYWFECSPIEWLVLESEIGNYLLLSKYLIDAGAYNALSSNVFEGSAIDLWLNGEFCDTAFALDNFNIKSRIGLLPYEGYLNSAYGFDSDAGKKSSTRECEPTDYAKARGAWVSGSGTSSYWTGTPSEKYDYCAWNVNSGGYLSQYATDGDSHCIRPSLRITK